jgi:hypothetical protein
MKVRKAIVMGPSVAIVDEFIRQQFHGRRHNLFIVVTTRDDAMKTAGLPPQTPWFCIPFHSLNDDQTWVYQSFAQRFGRVWSITMFLEVCNRILSARDGTERAQLDT